MSDRLNLIATMATQDKFSTFTKLMKSSGANEAFSSPGDFTVFVPTNEAFSKIPTDMMSELLNETNQTTLKALLSYHIVPGKLMAANLGSSPVRTSFTGQEIRFSDSNGLKVNGAAIQSRNIDATDGVIHALNTVLAPPARTQERAAKAAAASIQTAAVPADATSATGTAVPTAAASSIPTSPADASARADIKPII